MERHRRRSGSIGAKLARDLLLRKRDAHSYSRAVTTVRIQG